MVCLKVRALKDRRLGTAVIAVICGPLLAMLCLAAPQANPGKSDGGYKKIALIIHVGDQRGNPVAPSSVKDIQVTEHGRKLQVVDNPKTSGPTQIALLLDSNFHQRKVLPLEQQTAVEMLSEVEKEKAQALVMSYGAEIHSSGELTEVPSDGPAWRDWRNEGTSLAMWLCSRTTAFMAGRCGTTGTT